eukprot:Skav225495  [mRNA]  locus=scaffold1821:40631:44145:+ [translate_table: standard]
MAFSPSQSSSSSAGMNAQGSHAKLLESKQNVDRRLWPGEVWVQKGVSDQLADFTGMLASLRKPEPSTITQGSWRELLMVLFVRLKAKGIRCMRSSHELLPDSMLLLIWKVLQKALSPAEGQQLANMLTEQAILQNQGVVNLQDHIDRICSLMEFTDFGETIRYPSQFPERLGRAYIQHAFECASPLLQMNAVAA